MTIDSHGRCLEPCQVCGAPTQQLDLTTLERPAGAYAIRYDARRRTPTGGRYGDVPDMKIARIPRTEKLRACPRCRGLAPKPGPRLVKNPTR